MVGLGVDADPQLGEVRADDLVGDLGPADVRAEVAHAGDRRSSLLTLTVTRRMASSEVPGFSIQCIRKSFSWKSGRNSSPRPRTPNPVATNAAARITSAQPGRRSQRRQDRAIHRLQEPDQRRLLRAAPRRPVSSISDRAGVTVSATSSEARIASM